MTFPKDAEVQKAILTVIAEMGGEARPRDVYPRLTKSFPQLTPADLSRTLKSGDNAWTNRIQFVRQRLVERGELDKTTFGVWRITDRPPLATTHEQIVSMLTEIGERVGRTVTASEGPLYKHDVLWRKSAYGLPTEVMEVCDSGNLEKDILSLQWATDPNHWGSRGFLVVVDDRDMEKATKRLGKQPQIFLLSGSFVKGLHAIATGDNIPVLRAVIS